MMKLFLIGLLAPLGTCLQNIGICNFNTNYVWNDNQYLRYKDFAGKNTLFLHYATSNLISPRDISALLEFKTPNTRATFSTIVGTKIHSRYNIEFNPNGGRTPWILGVGYPEKNFELQYITVPCADAFLTNICDPDADVSYGIPTFFVSTMTNHRLSVKSLAACMNIARKIDSKVKLEPLVYDR